MWNHLTNRLGLLVALTTCTRGSNGTHSQHNTFTSRVLHCGGIADWGWYQLNPWRPQSG